MKLKEIRQEADITQQEVAEILKVARSTYSLWENEINIIPLIRLITFCNHFHVSLDYATGLTELRSYPNIVKEIDYETHQKRLKEIRRKNKLTQAELAKKLHTDNGVISRYEHGKTLILTSFLMEYAKIFNISCDYIMARIDEKVPLKELITN